MPRDVSVTIGFVKDRDRDRWHIYPTWEEGHDLDGTDCWCGPTFSMPCGQCDGEGCWNCERGWVETENAVDAVFIVHFSGKKP